VSGGGGNDEGNDSDDSNVTIDVRLNDLVLDGESPVIQALTSPMPISPILP